MLNKHPIFYKKNFQKGVDKWSIRVYNRYRKKREGNKTMSIYEYLEDIYDAQGIDAEEEEAQRIWNMFNNDEEAFDAFIAEKCIDLNAYTVDNVETDWQMWCWDMEG